MAGNTHSLGASTDLFGIKIHLADEALASFLIPEYLIQQ
jgi:hypothetical protein